MKTGSRSLTVAGLIVIAGTLVMAPVAHAAAPKTLDTAAIERLTGMKGEYNESEGVFKVSAPRSDLAVTVAGVK